ncbi:hypothetical protein [Helicobacter typhlonius]|uniref:hypothetical protein n=1 Tax=Helicobacter typhlonius TaxID=76936 RepID=UPI002FE31F79
MDSNVLIAGIIGVAGALLGAFLGAWLNPKMQEWQENNRIKDFLENIDILEKFIIYLAYKTTYLPLYKMGIHLDSYKDFNKEEIEIANVLNNSINLLDTLIRRLAQEQRIFVREDLHRGYYVSLNTNLRNFISKDKKLEKSLEESVKIYIAEEIYPLYESIITANGIFKVINTRSMDSTITGICMFMDNIQVFAIYGKDLSYLRADTQESFLNFPKGIFHPHYHKP